MKSLYSHFILLIAALLIPVLSFAQNAGMIKGSVSTPDNKPAEFISISLQASHRGTMTNAKGEYQLDNVSSGSHQLTISGVGYQTISKSFNIVAGQILELNFILNEDKQQLQTVEITGRKERTYKTKSTFIGNKTQTDILDLPQSVSYVSKELMADQGIVRTGDVVKNFSGVSQFTFYDDLTIRGFRVNGQSNTQLFNGMRTSTGFWKQPLTNYLERLEVLKGPASALYGNASPGGVVNRVTKKPLDETRKSIGISLGSFDTFRALADFTGPATKDSTLLYRLNLGYEDANSFRDLQFDKNVVVAPSLSFLPDRKTRINFDLVYNSSRSRLDRGQSVIGDDLNSTPISLALSTPNDRENENTYMVSFSLSRQLTDKLSFSAAYLKTGYDEDLYEHRSANAYASDANGKQISNMVAMQIFTRKRKRYIDNFSGFFNYKENTGPIEHKLVLGYDFGSEKTPVGASQLTASGYRNAANTGFIATYNPANKQNYLLDKNGNPVPNVPSFDLTNIRASQQLQDDSKAFFSVASIAPAYYYLNAGYAQDQLRWNRFQVLVGLRYEYYTDFSNYAARNEVKTNSHAWLPRVGVVYSIINNLNIYGSYVTGYNPQNAATLANPNAGGPFKPLESNMQEIGAKGDFLNGRLGLTTAVYRIKQNNVLYPANVTGQPDLLRQVGGVISKGIEFDVTGRITPYWSVIASYAYNRSYISESPVAKEVGVQNPNAPRNLANIWTRYNISAGAFRGVGFGAGTNYVGKRNLSINLTQSIPEYMLVNAAAYYTVGKVQLQLNANNVTGKKYWVGGYDYIRLFPGAPRNYLATLTYTFN
ncbi:TonB-dependent receptor [Mucilaginibacter gossypii]|uniref:TonB-dependent receptor n=1 Tax=Mucilaginibacter gossypii TaxID=551996 RepID=UPI000DCCFA97|nr:MULTISPECIES: TonB-dependent receptor [Mucilaginibacter]QTE39770.1 TonB-dependent receptor [Mucilaginibacter gossypii]RAV54150.1 TonB-dependent siderophore receptor [Mucilaginibacter rubeus]